MRRRTIYARSYPLEPTERFVLDESDNSPGADASAPVVSPFAPIFHPALTTIEPVKVCSFVKARKWCEHDTHRKRPISWLSPLLPTHFPLITYFRNTCYCWASSMKSPWRNLPRNFCLRKLNNSSTELLRKLPPASTAVHTKSLQGPLDADANCEPWCKFTSLCQLFLGRNRANRIRRVLYKKIRKIQLSYSINPSRLQICRRSWKQSRNAKKLWRRIWKLSLYQYTVKMLLIRRTANQSKLRIVLQTIPHPQEALLVLLKSFSRSKTLPICFYSPHEKKEIRLLFKDCRAFQRLSMPDWSKKSGLKKLRREKGKGRLWNGLVTTSL